MSGVHFAVDGEFDSTLRNVSTQWDCGPVRNGGLLCARCRPDGVAAILFIEVSCALGRLHVTTPTPMPNS